MSRDGGAYHSLDTSILDMAMPGRTITKFESSDPSEAGVYSIRHKVTSTVYSNLNTDWCDPYIITVYDCLNPQSFTVPDQVDPPIYYYEDTLKVDLKPFVIEPSICTITYSCATLYGPLGY